MLNYQKHFLLECSISFDSGVSFSQTWCHRSELGTLKQKDQSVERGLEDQQQEHLSSMAQTLGSDKGKGPLPISYMQRV